MLEFAVVINDSYLTLQVEGNIFMHDGPVKIPSGSSNL